MLRYAAWRGAIADYVAGRTGQSPSDLIPQTIAYATLGVSMAAFSCWVNDPSQDLEANLDAAYAALESGWSGALADPSERARSVAAGNDARSRDRG
jgi:hypothetical protein